MDSGIVRTLAALGFVLACSCSKKEPKAATEGSASSPASKQQPVDGGQQDDGGHVLVAITVDWEGAFLSDEGLDMLDAVRRRLPGVPFTHFVSAAYFTKPGPPNDDLDPATELKAQVKAGDELAIHVHAWESLARAANAGVHLAPSFVTGTNKLADLGDGDRGFDSDLDNYSVAELRAMIATSRRLLTKAGLSPSKSFRAGGYLGTPKVLEAARAEGLLVDSSAIDPRQPDSEALKKRLAGIWPAIDTGSQPYAIQTPAGDMTEVPIAAFVEDVSAAELMDILQRARERLAKEPRRDVDVVLGVHQESAQEFVPTLLDTLEKVRADPDANRQLRFVTVEAIARPR